MKSILIFFFSRVLFIISSRGGDNICLSAIVLEDVFYRDYLETLYPVLFAPTIFSRFSIKWICALNDDIFH